MGLTTWKNSPDGKVLKSDVVVAKNYLQQDEIDELNRIVTMYLDYAENQAKRNIPMKMEDWVQKLDGFLEFNDYKVLKNAGKVKHKIAEQLAHNQYEVFRKIQDQNFQSDFDKTIQQIQNKKPNE